MSDTLIILYNIKLKYKAFGPSSTHNNKTFVEFFFFTEHKFLSTSNIYTVYYADNIQSIASSI